MDAYTYMWIPFKPHRRPHIPDTYTSRDYAKPTKFTKTKTGQQWWAAASSESNSAYQVAPPRQTETDYTRLYTTLSVKQYTTQPTRQYRGQPNKQYTSQPGYAVARLYTHTRQPNYALTNQHTHTRQSVNQYTRQPGYAAARLHIRPSRTTVY